jgi:uncharacterized membrane protein
VLFLVTIAVIVLIVVTLLRWIDHLSRLGRVTETTERVEQATLAAMRARRQLPYLGGQALQDFQRDVPKTARPIYVSTFGYVQHVDTGALSKIAGTEGGAIYLRAIPGKLVDPNEPIAWALDIADDDQESAIRTCFSIADTRSFDQDPRFGASVLAEIASRALSPAVNDPGTAIDVITRAVRILAVWSEPTDGDADIPYPNIHVPPIELDDLFDDLFTPIARDGAGLIEVALRLQKALWTLSNFDDRCYAVNARRHSREALERSEKAMTIDSDRNRVRAVADRFATG